MSQRVPMIYILTNRPRGVLYVGVTGNIEARLWQHRNKLVKGFTQRYNLTRLVYCEVHSDFANAFEREKRLKRWRREWKFALIEAGNPDWVDIQRTPITPVISSEGGDPSVQVETIRNVWFPGGGTPSRIMPDLER